MTNDPNWKLPDVPPFTLESADVAPGAALPQWARATGAGGQDRSPALSWSGAPAGTQSFVLLMHDPDVALQRSTLDVTHWLVWNIPGTSTGLPEGVMPVAELPDGTRQVSLRAAGYMGPGAPATGPYHHYTFELYALDTKIDVPPGTPQEAANTRAAVMKAVDGHALGKAVIVGRFHQ